MYLFILRKSKNGPPICSLSLKVFSRKGLAKLFILELFVSCKFFQAPSMCQLHVSYQIGCSLVTTKNTAKSRIKIGKIRTHWAAAASMVTMNGYNSGMGGTRENTCLILLKCPIIVCCTFNLRCIEPYNHRSNKSFQAKDIESFKHVFFVYVQCALQFFFQWPSVIL